MAMTLSNNIINDGIASKGETFICYNKDKQLVIEFHTGEIMLVKHDAFFINTKGNKIYFASKNEDFNLLEFDVKTNKVTYLVKRCIRWLSIRDNVLLYTCDEANNLFSYSLINGKEELLLKNSCNYLCLLGDNLYFSNWSANKTLWKYEIPTASASMVLDIDVAWINTDGTHLIFRAWHNRKTYLYHPEKRYYRVLNSDGANYLHYSNGFIYYDSIRLGGLWKQSINNKTDKCCIYGHKVRRINSLDNTLFFQNACKRLITLNAKNLVPLSTLPYVEMVITTYCNMLCTNCSNGIPLLRERKHVGYDDFVNQVDVLLSNVSYIDKFQIHGGEPLLNPHLPRMIKYIRHKQKIKHVRIATNGTIIPSAELAAAMNGSNIVLAISSYKKNCSQTAKVVETCEELKIKYILYPEQDWYSFSSTPICNARDRFESCPINTYLCYAGWRLYLCSRICHCYSTKYDSCLIDIRDFDGNIMDALSSESLFEPCECCTISEKKILAGE